MTPIDDDGLAAQLTRRAGGLSGAAARVTVSSDAGRRIAAAVAQRVSTERQAQPRPWHRVLRPGALRSVKRPERFAALAAVALVAPLGATAILPSLTGSSPEPTPMPETGWYLTTDQLDYVVANASELDVAGKTIVANVELVDLNATCSKPPSAACPLAPAIAGSNRPIRVIGAAQIGRCGYATPTPVRSCESLPPAGSIALTIQPGFVDYLGTVAMSPGDPAWTVGQFLDRSASAFSNQNLMFDSAVVDGWLSSMGLSPPCASPVPGEDGQFGCGNASWLTSDSYRPTSGTPGSFITVEPITGVRVQNNAFQSFAPDSTAVDSNGLPIAQRGLYLLQPQSEPSPCALCSSGTGSILARVEPVPIRPVASVIPPTSNPTMPASSLVLDQNGLISAVRGARASGKGTGSVVVAWVTFDLGPNCTGAPGPAEICVLQVAGTIPSIPVVGPPAGPYCPPGSFCPLVQSPYVPPPGGPYALRINNDGTVTWLGEVSAVAKDGSSALPWSFGSFRALLTDLTPTDPAAHMLYPVEGWVSGVETAVACLPVPGEYGVCGWPAWLSGTDPRPSLSSDAQLTAPPAAIRLQNNLGIGTGGAVEGIFLLEPTTPGSPGCYLCDENLTALLLAGLEPPLVPKSVPSLAPLDIPAP